MPDQDALKDDIHKLGLELSGLKPMVREVHGYMPRIIGALELLAQVSEKLESNKADHQRIHYRITETQTCIRCVEDDLKELAETTAHNHDRLEEEFGKLREEHLVCTTTTKVERSERRKGFWPKVKAKIEERVVDILCWLLISFTVWMLLNHLQVYAASNLSGALKKAIGGE